MDSRPASFGGNAKKSRSLLNGFKVCFDILFV
jgi:hypothetical protein